jgi:GPI ethanolamine phosphate transferase 3 subunit O
MAVSTVCREERQPWCHVTFFFSGGTDAAAAEPPPTTQEGALFHYPIWTWRAHGDARRRKDPAARPREVRAHGRAFVSPTALVAGSACWLLEWLDSSGASGATATYFVDLRTIRTILAWTSLIAALGGIALWTLVPVTLDVSSDTGTGAAKTKKKGVRVVVLGFANAFGAPFVLLWTLALVPVWLASQPSAQITLALATIALLAHLELVDATRDARGLQSSFALDPAATLAHLQQGSSTAPGGTTMTTTTSFDEIAPLVLLAQLPYFATGHQATLSSLQWKSTVTLSSKLSYPLSPILVVLNTLGPTVLIASAAPLLAIWNRAPQQQQQQVQDQDREEERRSAGAAALLDSTRACLGISQYLTTLLLGTALSAAWLRRHLMVWKVFAPRYILAAFQLLLVDLVLIIGLMAVVGHVVGRVGRVFGQLQIEVVRRLKRTL